MSNVKDLLSGIKFMMGDSVRKTEDTVNKQQISLYDLIMKVANDESLDTVDKAHRPFVSQSTMFARPKQQVHDYLTWSGLQPVDLDFHSKELVEIIKPRLAAMLCKYPWCVAVLKSTSGSGLHVYTISKPLSIQTEDAVFVSSENASAAKKTYLDAYEAKLYVIWKCLVLLSDQLESEGNHDMAREVHPVNNTLSRRLEKSGQMSESRVVDASVCKISQPLFVARDKDVIINQNAQFIEQPEFDVSIYASVDAKFCIDKLKTMFDRLRGRFDYAPKSHMTAMTDGEQVFTQRDDITMIEEGTMLTITPQNYDNTGRYRLAYTLAFLYDLKSTTGGQYEHVLQMFLQMCSGNPKFNAEHNSWANSFRSAVERNAAGTCPCVWSSVKELREKHGFKFKFANKSSVTVNELIAEHNTEDAISQYIMSKVAQQKDFELRHTHVFKLAENEYLSTYKHELEEAFVTGINYLIARPGSGKTEFIKQLTRDGKRVMLIEPYTSILQSKIEMSDLGMYCSFGQRGLELSKHVNVALTFDKFTLADPEEVSILYDYVVVDESHLLTMSAYRDVVPANVIDNLTKLQTKVILMTGTPVAEHMFCHFDTVIFCDKPLNYNKGVRFVCCKHDGDKITKLASHISTAIKAGKRILFPTNKGDAFTHAIVGAVRMMLGRNPKVKYYKRDNAMHDFVQSINESGTIGDIELLFCTNYLSVGIDINDSYEFDVIYDEAFTGQEIEQFNSRLRKISIQSYVYFSMTKSNGDPRNITAYDELDLTLTNVEKLSFWDILQMQTKRNDSRSLFDFFEWAFNAPYFYRDPYTGEIKIHLTAYKLNMFEQKWRQWATQLVIIQNTLSSYGYECKVVQDVVADDMMIAQVLNAAKEARAEYRQEKNSKIGKMFASFVNQATFEVIMNLPAEQVQESDRFELVKKNGKLTYLVEDRRVFDDWRHALRTLSHHYLFDTIMKTIDMYVIDNKDMYRLARLKSIKDAVSIFDAGSSGTMHESNIKIVSYMLNDVFNNSKDAVSIASEVVDQIVKNSALIYFDSRGYTPQSPDVLDSVASIARRMFNAITVHDGDIYAIKQLPAFDSGYSRSRDSIAQMLHVLFTDDIFADNTERLLASAKLQSTISSLVFDKQQAEAQVSSGIISFKRVDIDNKFDDSNLTVIEDAPAKDLESPVSKADVEAEREAKRQKAATELERLADELMNRGF